MIVGHSMLAFAAVAGAGAALGWRPRRALRAGVAAAAFAVVPDVDMVYGPIAVTLAEGGDLTATLDAFWTEMARIHRLATHFLSTGAVAAVGVSAAAVGLDRLGPGPDGLRRPDRRGLLVLAAGVAVLAGLVAWTGRRFAALDAVVVAVYALAGVAVAVVALRRLDLDGWAVLAAAFVGLVSHPFGDLFAGEPPELLSPLVVGWPATPLRPFVDPTLDFLLVFGLELATVWCALVVCRLLVGVPDRRHLDARALLGVPYALAAFLAPVPAPDVWFYPEFSLLAAGGLWLLLGGVGLSTRPARQSRWRHQQPRGRPLLRAATTGLVAISLAAATYGGCYLVLGG